AYSWTRSRGCCARRCRCSSTASMASRRAVRAWRTRPLMQPDAPAAAVLGRYRAILEEAQPMVVEGRVREVVGLLAEVDGIPGRLGEMCRVERSQGGAPIEAEVVGFKGDRTLIMPLGDLHGVQAGARGVARGGVLTVPLGPGVLGRGLAGGGGPRAGRG